MLEFNGLSKKYGNFYALDNFTASLDTGIYALLGPNGAGKSTLMNILAGVLNATEGSIVYNGTNIDIMGEDFRDILGFMPQYPGFYPNFTAKRLMCYLGKMKGLSSKEASARADELLRSVNLYDDRNKRIGSFSGGMKQRVGLAQALINQPEVLILDEPTAGLDPKERIRFRNLISTLAHNMTVIFCTHIVSDIETIAKEVLLLHHGKLLKKASVGELTSEMNGIVWESAVSDKEAEVLIEQFPKSCLVFRNGRNYIRIINEGKPVDSAESCPPVLEDVYMHTFGDVK